MIKKLALYTTIAVMFAAPAFASKKDDDVTKDYLEHYRELKQSLDTNQELMLMRLNSDVSKMFKAIDEAGNKNGRLNLLLELQFDGSLTSEQVGKYLDKL